MFKHIVVGTDGSEFAQIATDKAIALAADQGAALTAVFVAAPYPYLIKSEVEKFTEGAKHAAQQAFDAMAAKLPDGVSFNTRFVESKSAEQAIHEVIDAVGADLLVVGSHGHSGLNRLLLGSVASKLINTAKVPVLVARA